MNLLFSLTSDLFHLFFPQVCAICSVQLVSSEKAICMTCLMDLPLTDFHLNSANPLSLQFRGRINLSSVAACYYFNKGGKVQKLLHAIKYGGNQEAAIVSGRYYGSELKNSFEFLDCSLIVPIPLHSTREKQRGYNQAELIASGISDSFGIQVRGDFLIRTKKGRSQTLKDRESRFQDLKGQFCLTNDLELTGKKIMLVDDVITSGATIEACASLFIAKGADVCVAALAWTSGE